MFVYGIPVHPLSPSLSFSMNIRKSIFVRELSTFSQQKNKPHPPPISHNHFSFPIIVYLVYSFTYSLTRFDSTRLDSIQIEIDEQRLSTRLTFPGILI